MRLSLPVRAASESKPGSVLLTTAGAEASLGKEGYRLEVTPTGVVIKINVFHWHLTDDDGWRVEIKKYPKLTQVGAWRGPKEALPPSYGSGDQRYGGFYTQAQIREVIAYAAKRHILTSAARSA